jgi:hypothetical protein
MSKPRPAHPDILKSLIARVDLLLKNGMVTKDFIISSEEASAVTGRSVETLRRYARYHHIPCIAYPGKNMYPLKEICEWVLKHYREATVTTSEMNGYRSVKRGRPRKAKTNRGIFQKTEKSTGHILT